MKILHVIIRLAQIDGGPAWGLSTLAKAQAQLGDNVTILPCSGSGGKPTIGPGNYGRFTVLNPPTNENLKFPNKALKRLLLDIVRDFDIIHIHGSWRYHLIAASSAAKKYNIPYIVRPAGNLGTIPRGDRSYIKWPYFMFVDKPIFKKASAIHCCTLKESDELQRLKIGTDIFVVPNPVDGSLKELSNQPEFVESICPGLKPDDMVVLYIGRIARIKQLPTLVAVFAKLSNEIKNAHLVIAGPKEDNNIVAALQSQINKNNIGAKVHMPGIVTGAAKATLYRRATIFVQPSEHENFGISAAEAMSFGKACVVNTGVGLSADIVAWQAGLSYNGTIPELENALRKVLLSEQLRQSCEKKAIELSKSFNPVTIAENLKLQYEHILKYNSPSKCDNFSRKI